ncbi:MAG TPA: translation initiation factor IF-3 [Vicinamibacteria bacterium]|nr:translation initiation factor IF-3 [Vicinamibacteria bacterium]
MNERIRAREIRLIDEKGEQVGIVRPEDALRMARERELDLVEIVAKANPPVCRIMNYGKYLYQKNKRAHEAKKHQKQIQVKEIKFRVKIDEHDYNFKKNPVERFLLEGNKVKTTIMFRGRERSHGELGVKILDRLSRELKDIALIENRSGMEGNQMYQIVSPKKSIVEKLKSSRDGGGATRVAAATNGGDIEGME